MIGRRRRPGRHECRRVVLHREADEPGARLWAVAAKSVIRELGIADYWRVDVGQDGADGFLVSVDYTPAGKAMRDDKPITDDEQAALARIMRPVEGGSGDHHIDPVPGTWRRADGTEADPFDATHYPITAVCKTCGRPIIERRYYFSDWEHVMAEDS